MLNYQVRRLFAYFFNYKIFFRILQTKIASAKAAVPTDLARHGFSMKILLITSHSATAGWRQKNTSAHKIRYIIRYFRTTKKTNLKIDLLPAGSQAK